MLAKIYSAAVYGIDAYEVEIEVNTGRGDPKIIIAGLPDTAVKESQDRVTRSIPPLLGNARYRSGSAAIIPDRAFTRYSSAPGFSTVSARGPQEPTLVREC